MDFAVALSQSKKSGVLELGEKADFDMFAARVNESLTNRMNIAG
jgi:hypothetical protein